MVKARGNGSGSVTSSPSRSTRTPSRSARGFGSAERRCSCAARRAGGHPERSAFVSGYVSATIGVGCGRVPLRQTLSRALSQRRRSTQPPMSRRLSASQRGSE
jgi:hypothetical protein